MRFGGLLMSGKQNEDRMEVEDARIMLGDKEIEQIGEAKEPKVISSCEMIFRSGLPSFHGDTLFMDNFTEGAQSLFKKTVDLLSPRYPIMPEYEGGYIPVKTMALGVSHECHSFDKPDSKAYIRLCTIDSFKDFIPSIATRFYSEESKKDYGEYVRFLGVKIGIKKILNHHLSSFYRDSISYTVVFEVLFQMIKQPKPDAKVSFMNAQILDYTGEI